MMTQNFQADVIIVGAGLAGMVAAHEAVQRGRRVLVIDQEGPQSLGGQALWSLGGLFMVDTPEQRRLGIRDSAELALTDWMASAQFDRTEDANPRAYAERFIEWSAGDMRGWLHDLGMRGGFRLSAGQNGAGHWPAAMAILSHGFISPGEPAQVSSLLSPSLCKAMPPQAS